MSSLTATRTPERRRTIRIKRSGLLRWELNDVDRPAVKIAETLEEYEQAFKLLHDVYHEMGYLSTAKAHGMLFGIHSLLPETVVFIAKSYLTVVSTLSLILDSPPFGLPMDIIYREEVDRLRGQGRRVAELSALVTPRKLRWHNLFMCLNQIMYHYARYIGVNDLCIAVNPKHVPFYKEILLFEDLGPQRHYPKVDAPAVALRVNMDRIAQDTKEAYDDQDFDGNLYAYFHKMTGKNPYDESLFASKDFCFDDPEHPPRSEIVRHFLEIEKSLAEGLTSEQRDFLMDKVPEPFH
jgi:hypothetical protein